MVTSILEDVLLGVIVVLSDVISCPGAVADPE
jgi:hypothetical protein